MTKSLFATLVLLLLSACGEPRMTGKYVSYDDKTGRSTLEFFKDGKVIINEPMLPNVGGSYAMVEGNRIRVDFDVMGTKSSWLGTIKGDLIENSDTKRTAYALEGSAASTADKAQFERRTAAKNGVECSATFPMQAFWEPTSAKCAIELPPGKYRIDVTAPKSFPAIYSGDTKWADTRPESLMPGGGSVHESWMFSLYKAKQPPAHLCAWCVLVNGYPHNSVLAVEASAPQVALNIPIRQVAYLSGKTGETTNRARLVEPFTIRFNMKLTP